MVHAFAVLLWLYPQPFRRRYAAEMSLDFEDALCAARAGGSRSARSRCARSEIWP